MIRICSSLAANGYTVLLVGRKLKTSQPLAERPFRQLRLNCIFNKGKLFYLEYNIRLFFLLLIKEADILCPVDLDTILPAFLVSRLRKKELAYDAHEYFTEVPEVISRPLVKKAWISIERLTVPRLKHAYTVGPAIAGLFREKYNTNFEVIRNVPNLLPLPPVIRSAEKYLIYQGALNKGRGLEALIAAMPEIDCRLRIIGEGDLSGELRALVSSLQLDEKVEFMGFVRPESLQQITREAYIGINVSENLGLSYYYSLNNKFFDYMHAGIPAVTNDFPEYRALNNMFEVTVFAEAEKKSLVKAVNLLLQDEALYMRLKRNCLLAREQLNWQMEEKKLLTFYERI
jgi:glycosyltransferase involved in cell wall biosynthesis